MLINLTILKILTCVSNNIKKGKGKSKLGENTNSWQKLISRIYKEILQNAWEKEKENLIEKWAKDIPILQKWKHGLRVSVSIIIRKVPNLDPSETHFNATGFTVINFYLSSHLPQITVL